MNPILLIILLLGSILRLYRLHSLPISLFGDEIDVGYHAWSLFTTGRDYLGNLLPTYIHSLSEYRAPLLMYLTAPFVGFLSPSAFSVRLPVALLGILNIYLVYLLANKLYPENYLKIKNLKLKIGYIAAAVLATTPWHIHYSRSSFEVTLLMSLIMLGTLSFLSKKYFGALALFSLTFYTYSIANIFTPLLILLLLFFFRQEKFRPTRINLVKSLVILIILLPIGYQLSFGNAAGRFNLISVLNDKKIIEDVILQRTAPWSIGDSLEPLFHNKVWAFTSAIGKSYLTSFSTDFLFINGDPNFRQSVSRFGELLWVSAPLILLGLVQVISKKTPANQFVLFLLLVAPLGSSLTQGGGNHATRLFVMLIPLTLLAAIGLNLFLEYLAKIKPVIRNLMLSFFVLLFLINLAGYWHRYENHYRFESARVWNYGYEPIFTQLKSYDKGLGKIYINNTYDPALLRFAFYTKLSPKEFQKQFNSDVPVNNVLPGFNGFRFGDRYFFGQIDRYENLSGLLQSGDLYLAVQGKEIPGDWDWSKDPPVGITALTTVRNFQNEPLMYLLKKAN